MTVRWILRKLDNSATYTFHINPNDADTLVPSRPVSWFRGTNTDYVGNHQSRQPLPWQFSGVLREQAQYNEILVWFGYRTKIELTTDLGQVLIVRLLSFSLDRRGPQRPGAPFRHTYVIKALVYP